MADTNRVQLSYVEESTLGTTPTISGATVMRAIRSTGETLNFNILNVTSNELRADRMTTDLIQSSAQNSGDINFEMSYPLQRTFLDQMIGAALFNSWSCVPYKNNVTAASEITSAASSGVFNVASGGAAFIAGHLVRATGFTNAGNNTTTGAAKVTASGATSVTLSGGGLSTVSEASPPVGATLQVVGFQFGSGDVAATSTGLSCTAGDFTTIGLSVGKWIKVGGSATGEKFATPENNGWVRVTAIAAKALTLDNLPTGWSVDSGTGKTIDLWYGDTLKNGTTVRSFTVEKGFLDVTQYFAYKGMVPGQMSLSLSAQNIMTGAFNFLGTTHTAGASSLGTPVAASVEDVMSSMANVGRMAEGGTVLGPTNYAQSMTVQVQNNLRAQSAIGLLGLVGIGTGRCDVSGNLTCYFSDRTQYDKYLNGTASSFNFRTFAGSRAFIATIPSMEFESGTVTASAGNQDVMAQFGWRAKLDTVTNAEILFDRVPYFE